MPARGSRFVAATALVLLTAAAHWTVFSAGALTFDDYAYMARNKLVQNPSWDSARRFLSEVSRPSTVEGYYQPLNMISLMVDCAMGGRPDDLRIFHITSLSLHIANTLLIAALILSLFRSVPAAFTAALLFGLHPMTVEPIAWVGERKTLLAACGLSERRFDSAALRLANLVEPCTVMKTTGNGAKTTCRGYRRKAEK